MIPTYNCADYLRETLVSVLAQDPGPAQMQIEVIDDCSTADAPEAVVREIGRGRVGFFRQASNVGHIRNFETGLLRSRGEIVHLLHGDDVVRDGFYAAMERVLDAYPEAGAAFCRHLLMDERGHWSVVTWLEQSDDGLLENWLERIVVEPRIQTPAIVVRRETYERLGGFDRRLTCCGEDWEMWVRIAATSPVAFVTEPLAAYRMRSDSLSGTAAITAADTADLRRVTHIIAEYLPQYVSPDRAPHLLREARKNVAVMALQTARRQLQAGNRDVAVAQARAALACSRSRPVVAGAAAIAGRLLLDSLSGSTRPSRMPTLPAPGRQRSDAPCATGVR